MKKFAYLLVLLLIACQPKPNGTDKLVTVSILPQKYFVDQISGGKVEVNVLVPPGADPHEYSVLPSQMRALSKSKLWLQIGLLGFEKAWENKIADVNKSLKLVNCSNGIALLADSDEHGAGADPHIWLAPDEAKVMARNSFDAMKNAFPEDSASFRKNFERFISGIDSLSVQVEKILSGMKNRSFLIFHPTLGYFSRQYHLEQIPIELEGKEPSPRHMKELVDQAREKAIHAIFIQKEFNKENAVQLSREINGEVVTIDPLNYNWKKEIVQIAQKLAAQQ